ncbi:MAG: pilus assembly protein PilY, partial [Gammaproteobacteria bacterium]|nr:pilus assembly protein PilY [Gammaproteobacteria bacterium]
VQNYFFSIVDNPTVSGWLDDDDGNPGTCGSDIICLEKLTQASTAGLDTGARKSTKGWRLPLATGEQVVTGAITVADVTNFSTHIPARRDDVCKANLGTATSYSLDYRKAKGDEINIVGGGLVPTPVAGMVILDNGKKVPFCIGCGGEDSAIGAKLVGSGIKWKQPKSRVYWKIQQ